MDFQNGPLKGFDNRNAAVYDLQDGKCLLCGGKIEHYHHIVPKSRSGSNTLGNIAGLCKSCHDRAHKDAAYAKQLEEEKQGLDKKYGGLSVLNQAIPFLCQELEEEFGRKHVFYCTGRDTARVRTSLGYQKTKKDQLHEVNAWCIGLLAVGKAPEKLPEFHTHRILQFRRQDRSLIDAQVERTYKLDGKTVAKNRKKRTEQKTDSLEEWFEKQVQAFGKRRAERKRSRLTVVKAYRRYNDPNRLMPGAVFLYQGVRYVVRGRHCKGAYLQAVGMGVKDFPTKKCKILKQNTGLVFVA